MSTRAVAANGELVANTDTYVSSNLAFSPRVFLPSINDGSGSSVAVGTDIRIEALSNAAIDVVTLDGHQVGQVPAFRSALVIARAGVQQGVADSWSFRVNPTSPAAFVADAPAGGTGATAGAWDTAGHRDAAIATINAMKAALIKAGYLKAE